VNPSASNCRRASAALGRRQAFECVVQPAVERAGRHERVRPAQAQIVEAQAAAEDQHALLAQRRERAAGGKMQRRIVRVVQAQLEHRHVGFRIHHRQWREGAVVEATGGVDRRRKARATQQRVDAVGQFGGARRRVLN